MTDIDLTAINHSLPTIRLYASEIDEIIRSQTENVAQNGVLNQGRPDTQSLSLKPGEIIIRGVWVGTSAKQIATTFRDDYIDNEDVTDVNLAGDGATTAFDGDYKLSSESEVDSPVLTREGQYWSYSLRLTEI